MTTIPPHELLPHASIREREINPNSMSPEQFEALTDAISSLGFLQPVLVVKHDEADYELIDGHHRWKAAGALGMQNVPAYVVEDLDDAEAMVRLLSMNRLRGEQDLTMVASIMDDLVSAGWSEEDLTVTGFTDQEISILLESNASDPDDLPAPPAAPEPEDEDSDSVAEKAFALEVSFRTRDELVAAKKGLRKASGKSGDLGRGLLRVLGILN